MSLTPRQIVEELDKYIIGQSEAKKAVAVALRNRYTQLFPYRANARFDDFRRRNVVHAPYALENHLRSDSPPLVPHQELQKGVFASRKVEQPASSPDLVRFPA